jgi:hypothetical protein
MANIGEQETEEPLVAPPFDLPAAPEEPVAPVEPAKVPERVPA